MPAIFPDTSQTPVHIADSGVFYCRITNANTKFNGCQPKALEVLQTKR